MPMVLAYVVSLLLLEVGGFINSFERGVRAFGVYGLAFNSSFPFIVVPACIIAGRLLSVPRARQRT